MRQYTSDGYIEHGDGITVIAKTSGDKVIERITYERMDDGSIQKRIWRQRDEKATSTD